MTVEGPKIESPTQTPDIRVLYEQYGAAVHRRCMRLCRNEAKAWDLTQETFLRAHKYAKSFRGGSVFSWLLTIADRTFLTHIKKERDIPTEDVAKLVRDVEVDAAVALERLDLVSKILTRVPKDVAQMAIHRYFDEWEHQQIADAMNVSEKTVRRKLERFLSSARKLVGG